MTEQFKKQTNLDTKNSQDIGEIRSQYQALAQTCINETQISVGERHQDGSQLSLEAIEVGLSIYDADSWRRQLTEHQAAGDPNWGFSNPDTPEKLVKAKEEKAQRMLQSLREEQGEVAYQDAISAWVTFDVFGQDYHPVLLVQYVQEQLNALKQQQNQTNH